MTPEAGHRDTTFKALGLDLKKEKKKYHNLGTTCLEPQGGIQVSLRCCLMESQGNTKRKKGYISMHVFYLFQRCMKWHSKLILWILSNAKMEIEAIKSDIRALLPLRLWREIVYGDLNLIIRVFNLVLMTCISRTR